MAIAVAPIVVVPCSLLKVIEVLVLSQDLEKKMPAFTASNL
jgi:hypothetical protein